MANQNIFTIIIKIIGIYFFIQAVQMLSFLQYGFSRETISVLFVGLGFAFLYIILALVVIKWADFIANKIAGRNKDSRVELNLTANELSELIFLGIGVFLALTALTSLVNVLTVIISNKIMLVKFGSINTESVVDIRTRGELISSLFKLILGIALTLRYKGLNNAIKKLREAQ